MYVPLERRFRVGPSTYVRVGDDSRANFTNQISNAVSLSLAEASLTKSPEDLLISDAQLRAFLHEATHHGSFAGPVGKALAALAVSSGGQAGIPGSVPEDEGGLFLPARDYLVLQWTETIYEPIVEGTALFAEYDIVWGDCPFTSLALCHAILLYLMREVNHGATVLEEALADPLKALNALNAGRTAARDFINTRLKSARNSDEALEQKEYLLSQPLISGNGEHPYLLGYLATKRAYLTLRRATEVRDVDAFLIFMGGFWFSDRHLCKLLLSVSDAHASRIEITLAAIADHFQDRWNDLYKRPGTNGRAVMQNIWEELSEEKVSDPSTVVLSDEVIGIGFRTASYSINAFTPKFLKHRLTLRYGMTTVDIRNGGGIAEVRESGNGRLIGHFRSVSLADEGSYPGTLELVRSDNGRHHGVVILGPTGLVAVKDMVTGDWNTPELIEYFDDLPSIDQIKAMALAVAKTPWAKTWTSGRHAEIGKLQLEQAPQVRDLIFLQIAFPGAREAGRSRIVEAMGKTGFTGLFGSGYQLRQLARYSVVFGGPGALIGDIAASIGTSKLAVLSDLAAFNEGAREALGVDLFEIDGEHATSAV